MIYYILFLQFSFSLAYDYPWLVSITGREKGEDHIRDPQNHLCAGVFVKEYKVLTSAHCIEKRHKEGKTDFFVHTLVGTENTKEFPVYKVEIHSDWNKKPTHLLGDLAVLSVNFLTNKATDELDLPNKSYYPNGKCWISDIL